MEEREVEDFMDEYLARQLEKEKIPGATVSVVEDGKVLLAKDYGQAHVWNDEPVAADEVVPLGEYLSENVPARVRPPGELTSYSNYGMALADHVVEDVSGMPYDRYLEENVFGPPGMQSTTAAGGWRS